MSGITWINATKVAKEWPSIYSLSKWMDSVNSYASEISCTAGGYVSISETVYYSDYLNYDYLRSFDMSLKGLESRGGNFVSEKRFNLRYPCLCALPNDTRQILVIGGKSGGSSLRSDVFLYNVETQTSTSS